MSDFTKRLMEGDEVRRFFPANLADIVQFPSEVLKYFGIAENKTFEITLRSLYLAALVEDHFLRKEKKTKLDFRDSTNTFIVGEGNIYTRMTEEQEGLNGYSPLLVLRTLPFPESGRTTSDQCKFVELRRYADHAQFRRRGLATATLELVSTELMASYGTKFLYVNYDWTSWPKASKVIPVDYASDDLIIKINPFVSSRRLNPFGFFKLTNKKEHQAEYEKAMRKWGEHRASLERFHSFR